MQRIFFILLLPFLSITYLHSQSVSLSGNYLYQEIRNGSGIDIQAKIYLDYNLCFMADFGYFFPKKESEYFGEPRTISSIHSKNSYYTGNMNFAYNARIGSFFSVLPYVGIGCLYSITKNHSTNIIAPDNNQANFMANLGLLTECKLYKNLFATIGLKYMVGIKDFDEKNSFCLNIGLGYYF